MTIRSRWLIGASILFGDPTNRRIVGGLRSRHRARAAYVRCQPSAARRKSGILLLALSDGLNFVSSTSVMGASSIG